MNSLNYNDKKTLTKEIQKKYKELRLLLEQIWINEKDFTDKFLNIYTAIPQA